MSIDPSRPSLRYVLEGREVRAVSSAEYDAWSDRVGVCVLFLDDLEGLSVSTVFLGVNSSGPHVPPDLFETMIFANGDVPDGLPQQLRYPTYDEAEAGHAYVVAAARAWLRDRPVHEAPEPPSSPRSPR